jgi:hypothetical protein
MYTFIEFMDEQIEVKFGKKSIHIVNTPLLRRVLRQKHAALCLAKYLKQIFAYVRCKELNISDQSLAVEIMCHVYIGNVADMIKKNPIHSSQSIQNYESYRHY